MKDLTVEIQWPNGKSTFAKPGDDWLRISEEAETFIPTGCLGGSCGACEIEVNGEILRACINSVPNSPSGKIKVDFCLDPYW